MSVFFDAQTCMYMNNKKKLKISMDSLPSNEQEKSVLPLCSCTQSIDHNPQCINE